MNMPYTEAYRFRVGGVRVSLTRAALTQLLRGGRSTELRLRSRSGRRLSQAQSCPSRPEQSESASDALDSFSCSCSAIPGVREHDARFGRDSDAVIRGGSQDGKDSSVTVPEGRLMSFSRKSWQIINLSFFSEVLTLFSPRPLPRRRVATFFIIKIKRKRVRFRSIFDYEVTSRPSERFAGLGKESDSRKILQDCCLLADHHHRKILQLALAS
jgi:hypothetical protein